MPSKILVIQLTNQIKIDLKDFDLQKRTLIDLQQNNNQLNDILTNCEKLIQVNLLF
jgi:predicted membrane chloride channel (bestrophin family)